MHYSNFTKILSVIHKNHTRLHLRSLSNVKLNPKQTPLQNLDPPHLATQTQTHYSHNKENKIAERERRIEVTMGVKLNVKEPMVKARTCIAAIFICHCSVQCHHYNHASFSRLCLNSFETLWFSPATFNLRMRLGFMLGLVLWGC